MSTFICHFQGLIHIYVDSCKNLSDPSDPSYNASPMIEVAGVIFHFAYRCLFSCSTEKRRGRRSPSITQTIQSLSRASSFLAESKVFHTMRRICIRFVQPLHWRDQSESDRQEQEGGIEEGGLSNIYPGSRKFGSFFYSCQSRWLEQHPSMFGLWSNSPTWNTVSSRSSLRLSKMILSPFQIHKTHHGCKFF